MSEICPIDDNVLVQPIDPDERTPGGIVLPDNAREKSQKGRIVAVGNGKMLDCGQRAEMTVKAGQEVLFSKYAGTEIKVDGEKFQIMREADILAVLR